MSSNYPVLASEYELGPVIGQGASSTVRKAVVKTNGEQVAVKILNLETLPTPLEEVHRECAILASMHHPNVVSLFASFIVGHHLWLVMPYVAGGSVLDIMRHKFRDGFAEQVIATILKPTLEAIEYFHSSNMIHRDIKAGNILLGGDGSVHVADFGVSAFLIEHGEHLEKRNTFVGTPCWMAPEALGRAGYNEKADIWSFGMTAIELALGEVPLAKFDPVTIVMRIVNDEPPQLPKDTFSRSFRDLVQQCLQKDPERRPTATKLLEHRFFRIAKKGSYLVDHVLNGLPTMSVRASRVTRSVSQSQATPSSLDDADWDFDDDDGDPQPAAAAAAAAGKGVDDDDDDDSELDDRRRRLPPGDDDDDDLVGTPSNGDSDPSVSNAPAAEPTTKGRFTVRSQVAAPASAPESAKAPDTEQKGRFSVTTKTERHEAAGSPSMPSSRPASTAEPLAAAAASGSATTSPERAADAYRDRANNLMSNMTPEQLAAMLRQMDALQLEVESLRRRQEPPT